MSQKKVLIANRGEIACRIIRTLEKLDCASVAIYSEVDRDAPHVALASEAYPLGGETVKESYLQIDKILDIARQSNAGAIHPGYGLLSENADFASRCEEAGLAFLGPAPAQIRAFGLKHEARRLAEMSNVPLLPGSRLLENKEQAYISANDIGFPVMLKSTAGGGGIGMQVCHSLTELSEAYERVERLSNSHFGQGGIFLEKFLVHARHLEVQIFGDGRGHVTSLGVRDCSSQRRNQKVMEETPPPHIPQTILDSLQEAALRLTEAVKYRSAGTVEFIYDNDTVEYYFLEVNTRLQVEHGITELVTNTDIVAWMVNLGFGEIAHLPKERILPQQGHAIQARLYAEDPFKDFQPSSGLLTHVVFPEGVRCDSWVLSGTHVSPFYDPLLAKLQVHAANRNDAVVALQEALAQTRLDGIETNLHYLRSVVAGDVFCSGSMVTRSLSEHQFQPDSFEILRAGTMTTVQDFPGRTGYWEVGVPPSGPMDTLAFRLGNSLLGNAPDAAGLELTANGPRIQFNAPTAIILTGAAMATTLNGRNVAFYQTLSIAAGDILDIGKTSGHGVRAYLCVRGGIDVPCYLGSRSTFTLGQFGGHGGRALRTGDVLHITTTATDRLEPVCLPVDKQPRLTGEWEIGVLYGPHGSPDFFTQKDIETFFSTAWEVHYNSARTGVRLIGPKPEWAREDGGEAGLHPSNLHDNAYAIGAIDFTGDMPVILGPDGPSLGGFVCPATIIEAERWKMGQLKPGDTVRFRCLTPAQALHIRLMHEARISQPLASEEPPVVHRMRVPEPQELILHSSGEGIDQLVIRQSGDAYILAEFGPMALDFKLRFRVHVLHEALEKQSLPAVEDLTAGVRSIQIHFDPARITSHEAVSWLLQVYHSLPPIEQITVPSRIVHLPLSWDDPSTREAIQKYMQSVNPDAPWCPDNIEFIRRINGLHSRQAVYDIVFSASYVVLGLGDVYLGAPVATPLDPRHRLVTTKYNPARTWTPENAVGIGGAYMCVYGMEGPGGYQFVGRTIQMWNRYRTTDCFHHGKPWLLRLFDQVRFYPVTEDELKQLRHDFPQGRFTPKIEEGYFKLCEYEAFLRTNASSINAFKQQQTLAFEEERQRWKDAGLDTPTPEDAYSLAASEVQSLPEGSCPLDSSVAGSVWKVIVTEGQTIAEGDVVAILESMKMEISLQAHITGKVTACLCKPGQNISPGQTLFAIEPAS